GRHPRVVVSSQRYIRTRERGVVGGLRPAVDLTAQQDLWSECDARLQVAADRSLPIYTHATATGDSVAPPTQPKTTPACTSGTPVLRSRVLRRFFTQMLCPFSYRI